MNPGDLQIFGTLLKAFRTRRHLTQQHLAASTGVHRSTIGRWEQGNVLPASKGIVLELARLLHLNAQEMRQLLAASLTTLPPFFQVPYPRNPFFTGREEILEALHVQLDSKRASALTQSSALHGLGGVGKTQIALEYAYRYARTYSALCWIRAETAGHIISSFLCFAEILQVATPGDNDQQRVVAAVQQWLNTHSGWLLIWDNVEDLDLLLRFQPGIRNGATLLTTRSAVSSAFAPVIDLSPMGHEEGVLFLLRRAKLLPTEANEADALHLACTSPEQYMAAEALVIAMGGLPLALDQAGAYSEETGCSLSDYLQRYRFYQARLLDRRGNLSRYHPHSVGATFRLALEQVEREHRAAAGVLRACALLHAEAIPEEVFIVGASCPGLALAPASFEQAVAVLQSLSLLEHQPETRTLSLHRLVQAVVREWMGEQERELWQRRLLTVLNALFPADPCEADRWEQYERLLAHVLLVTAALPDCAGSQERVEVLCKAADYLHERARYEQAEALYLRAIHLGEQAPDSEHLALAHALDGLAFLCGEQGKYEQAEALGKRALHLRKQALGPEHSLVAHSLNTLGVLFTEQEKYTEAEPLLQHAIRIWEQAAGPDSRQVATPLNRLGLLYWRQAKYTEAEVLLRRAIRIWEQTAGPDSSQVASSLNNLALLYWKQGEYAQAAAVFQRVVRVEEQAYGPAHPLLAYTLTGQAILCAEQGKYTQAEPLFQRALHIRERTWGPDHHLIAISLLNLGELKIMQGKYAQAEPLVQRALHIWERRWGPAHHQVASALKMLADLSAQQGKHAQAEALFRRALHIWEQEREPGHPDLAALLAGLGNALRAQGKETEAHALSRRAPDFQELHSGQNCLETAQTLDALAVQLTQEGRSCEARSACERALHMQEQAPGNAHPHTVATYTLYTQIQESDGQVAPPSESDPLQVFLAACCELHPLARCTIRDVWDAYEHWTTTVQGYMPLSRRAFTAQLTARGCQTDRTSSARIWRGIRLTTPSPGHT